MSVIALLGLSPLALAIEPEPEPAEPAHIVNGTDVEVCAWPTVLYSGGCTASLVHPKAIATAQHCGAPTRVQFGEDGSDPRQGVRVLDCVGTGSDDAMLCELEEEITELPVTPVLYGCELETWLQEDQPVVITGFGQTQYGVGGGEKLWADQIITRVESGRVIVGDAGDGTSPCPGDSGGPLMIQVADGSWRVAGTVLGGTTSIPCNSAANYQRLDPVVPHFEEATGLDITPCFDGQTGAWDPGPDCGGFSAAGAEGVGTWDDWCEGTPVGGLSEECGAAWVDPDAVDSSGVDSGVPPSDSGGGGDKGGCACQAGGGLGGVAVTLLGMLAALRRRRG